jgi:hypothetical protein
VGERLEDAAIVFMVFEVISMSLIAFVLAKFFLLAFKILDVLWDILYIILAILAALSHVIATILWFVETDAFVDCEIDDPTTFDDDVDICALSGPVIHMLMCIILPVFSVIAVACLITKMVERPVEPILDETFEEESGKS